MASSRAVNSRPKTSWARSKLVAPAWKKAGIGLLVRPYERSVLRNRAYAGESVMTVWSGFENGVPPAGWSVETSEPNGPQWSDLAR